MSGHARVFVVTAHPDDMEILCGGTVARFTARGDEVTTCHVCTGHLGHKVIPSKELVAIRWEEADRAARLAGARHLCLGLDDLSVFESLEKKDDVVARLATVIREVRPTVVITHDPNDYMSDHADLAHLVLKASFVATLPQFPEVPGEAYPFVSPVYFMETMMGVGFVPEEYVDITDAFETKRAMLECHKSQVEWLRDHDRVDVVENMRICAAYRGLQCGVRYAEGFRRYRVWPRMSPERHLP